MSEVRKCKPNKLKVGDYFSYPGSFKIYRVLTDPMEDPEFSSTYNCKSCGQIAQHKPRFIFDVTDGGRVNKMGIRLISDTVCSIHRSFDVELLPKNSALDPVQAALNSAMRDIKDPRRSVIVRLAYSHESVDDEPGLVVWFVFDPMAQGNDIDIVKEPHVRHLIESALLNVVDLPIHYRPVRSGFLPCLRR